MTDERNPMIYFLCPGVHVFVWSEYSRSSSNAYDQPNAYNLLLLKKKQNKQSVKVINDIK